MQSTLIDQPYARAAFLHLGGGGTAGVESNVHYGVGWHCGVGGHSLCAVQNINRR